jgi:hypothetical protein
MADRRKDFLSEEEAARVWRRAARLQNAAGGEAETTRVDDDEAIPTPEGYALTHVKSAAIEAGIASEFVESALRDVLMESALPETGSSHALARRFLNDPPGMITSRRVVEGTPEEVFSVMQTVLPENPYRLTLTDKHGDPLDGGVLVFDLPAMASPFERGFAFAAADAGLKQLSVSLRPIEGSPTSCEITVSSPVTSHNVGFGLGVLVTTLAGGAGLATLGTLGMVTGVGPVGFAVGALLGGGFGRKGFRALYRGSMQRAQRALDGLVGAVATRVGVVW